jgi:hypothetical protein
MAATRSANQRDTESTEKTSNVSKDHSFDPVLKYRNVEVDEQAYVSLTETKIRQELGFMDGEQLLDRLEFNDQAFGHVHIHYKVPVQDFAFVHERKARQRLALDSLKLEFVFKATLIDRFQ